ncbi:MAG TPA: magnesium-translocating P-type ATPase [Gemmatimonadales bacterium]|nr:magnesium-translocating P-type ATPase [Gemmatimonadales bacterium]
MPARNDLHPHAARPAKGRDGTRDSQPLTRSNETLPGLLARLGTSPAGLSQAEAARRLTEFGPNVVRPRRERTALLEFLSRFRNPLIVLLLAASGISALTGDVASFGIIAGIVVLSVTLDFVQEHRAGQAAERLRQAVAVRVAVLRDGHPSDVETRELVAGDVVLLSAGNLVPADGVILDGRDFFVNEALLTGEPYPVEKRAAAALDTTPLDAETHAVFMGTVVVSGTARVVVVRTGRHSALGEIGQSLVATPPPTAFELGTRRFGLLILRVAILMVLFVILVNAVNQRPRLESFLFAVALAVGLTPELLPMIASVTLARGAMRMAAKRVIVKQLVAISDLGAMDVLCTDKTGTLTEAKVRLERHLDPLGRDSARVLELVYLNSYFESGLRSPLDAAVLQHTEVDVQGWEKIDEVPFGFERRRVSVLVQSPVGTRLLIVKGAVEDVLRLSAAFEADDPSDRRPLDTAGRQAMQARFEELCRAGFRVLGVAWKQVAHDHEHAVIGDESDLVFAGFAAFEDPPKASAGAAVRALEASGVTVKVITGDHELVARSVCAKLGLGIDGAVTGDKLQQLTDPALDARVERASLFCRVTPVQKNRIILALRRRGHVVGYLGDGINDAPSLQSADVGVSVAGAVDIAREAADLILLDQDLGVLHTGVLEGRRTFGNIMKYIMMASSSNFGNMLSMAAASVFLPFLPLLPVQVLLNNFLYDLSEVPIPLDTVDDEFMRRPHRWNIGFVRNFMLAAGPVSSAFDFMTFFVLLRLFGAGETLFHTGWFIESLATQVLVIFIIRTRGSPLQSRPSRLLTSTSLAVVATAILLPLGPIGRALGFVRPPAAYYMVVAILVVGYLATVEVVKRWFYRRFTREGGL